MSRKRSDSTTRSDGSKTEEPLGLDLDHEEHPYSQPMPAAIAEQLRRDGEKQQPANPEPA